MSFSTDGKILIWNENLQYPQRGYILIRKKNQEIGIVGSLSFSQCIDDRNTIILGTEAGSIFKIMILPNENQFQQKKWKPDASLIMQNVNAKFIPEIQ